MRIARWWYTAPLRLRSILRYGRVERELDEELQFHLEHKIEEGLAKGLSAREARFAALRAMDGLEQRKEEMRDTRRVHWLTDFVDDVRYAMRSLRLISGTMFWRKRRMKAAPSLPICWAVFAIGLAMRSAVSVRRASVLRSQP